jgi:hypothetical protein
LPYSTLTLSDDRQARRGEASQRQRAGRATDDQEAARLKAGAVRDRDAQVEAGTQRRLLRREQKRAEQERRKLHGYDAKASIDQALQKKSGGGGQQGQAAVDGDSPSLEQPSCFADPCPEEAVRVSLLRSLSLYLCLCPPPSLTNRFCVCRPYMIIRQLPRG